MKRGPIPNEKEKTILQINVEKTKHPNKNRQKT